MHYRDSGEYHIFYKGNVMKKEQRECVISWLTNLISPGLLTILTVIFYYQSLRFPFQFDDIANISKKFAIRFDNPLSRWWISSRWLGDFLNSLNYQIGRFDPFMYRLFNLVIHIITGLIVFYLVKKLCSSLKEHSFFNNYAHIIAFITSGFFLLHPVQTQTVSYVIQARIEGLASLFVLLTILCFVYFATSTSLLAKGILGILCCASAFLSCGTKEIVVVTPILLLFVDWFFISNMRWDNFKSRLFFHIIFSLAFILLMIHYLSPKFALDAVTLKTATGNNKGNILTEHAYDVIMPFQFLISQFKVIVHYLVMFIWPLNISVEYDWKMATSFFSWDVIFPFFILLSLLVYSFMAAIKRLALVVPFGLLWFFTCVAPRSTLIPSPEFMYDYKTYLASVGIYFIFAVVIARGYAFVCTKLVPYISLLPLKTIQVPVVAILMLPIGFMTLSRNKVWGDAVSFWEDNVKKAPLKARAYNNYGVALSEAGRIDDSIKAYLKALELDKHYCDPLSNLSVSYSLKGEFDKAIDALKQAINLYPDYAEAYNNLGTLLIQKGEFDRAEAMLKTAIQLRPYYGKAYHNLGRLYLEQKKEDQAFMCFKSAVKGDLDTPDGFFTYGQMSLRMKHFKDAVYAFEQVIARGVSTDQVWFGLANAYYMNHDYDRAEAVYTRLARDNPLDERYFHNLAETKFIQKKYAHAFELFKKVINLPHPVPQAFLRVSACLEQLDKKQEARAFLQSLLRANAPDQFKQVVQSELKRMEQSKRNRSRV